MSDEPQAGNASTPAGGAAPQPPAGTAGAAPASAPPSPAGDHVLPPAKAAGPLCPVCADAVAAGLERCPRCQAGIRLHGRYVLERLLGSGGQGRTFAARDLDGKASVAVKELSLARVRDWKSVELFRREATVLSGLDHPGVPRLIEYFEEERAGITFFYLVQELVDGVSLAVALRHGARWNETQVRALAGSVLEILEYLHGQSPPVIHRDLKPSNILQRPDGSVTLVDFGLVRDVARPEGGSTLSAGTPGYAPLEQFAGRAVPATDLYALGATLVALLARRDPADLLSPRTQRLEFRDHVTVSADLARLLERLLEPDPTRRYESAAEVRRDLGHASGHAAEPAPAPWRTRRARLIAAATALLAGAGLLGYLGVTRFLRPQAAERRLELLAGLPQRYAGTVRSVTGLSSLKVGQRCMARVTFGRDRLGRDDCRVSVECGSAGVQNEGLSFGTRSGDCRVTPGPSPTLIARSLGPSQYVPTVALSASRAGGRLVLYHEGQRSYRVEIQLDPE
ncbi:MAG: serine/threonine protein kinase [Deltaproteobacteria bacterium]|nr:serine/threonine protein kinase [Deltaproteobacteria bacterium]